MTLNPAIQLGIDNRVGSIDVGKDADLVIYNHNPLSVYAVAQKTLIDGTVYFDRDRDIAGRPALESREKSTPRKRKERPRRRKEKSRRKKKSRRSQEKSRARKGHTSQKCDRRCAMMRAN